MNASSRGGAVAAVAIVLALIGWAVWKGPDQDPTGIAEAPAVAAEAEAEAATDGATESAAETDGAATTESSAEVATESSAEAGAVAEAPSAAPTPPMIDVLRVAPDGTATLAGRAGAGAMISVLVDGAEAASVAADGAGQFATIFSLAPSAAGRMLSLVARAPDGTLTEGAEMVAIAPIPEPEATPEVTAEAAPAPAEAEAPAAIKITEAGAEVLQAPAAEGDSGAPGGAVTLDVISYAANGAVQLGGTGTAGATLRIYLDNAEIGALPVAEDGAWTWTTADIVPGIYTLRIDQLDAAGAVISRIETPFKRETLEALAAAAAPAPEPEVSGEAAVSASAEGTAAPEPSAQPEEPPADPALAEAPQADADVSVDVDVDADASGGAGTADEAAPATGAAPEAIAAMPAADAAPSAATSLITVTVQPGFTLWAIARDNLGAGILYVQVFEANRSQIKDPDLIYPGQVLTVPASP